MFFNSQERDNELYAQGVKEGKTGNFFTDIAECTSGCFANRDAEIRSKGYKFGKEHRYDGNSSDYDDYYEPETYGSYSHSSYESAPQTIPVQARPSISTDPAVGVALCAGVIACTAAGIFYLWSMVPRYKNLENRKNDFAYERGQKIENRHMRHITLGEKKNLEHLAKNKSYRGFLNLNFNYPWQSHDQTINLDVSMQGEDFTQFEKVKTGWFSSVTSIKSGQLFKKIDISRNGRLESGEIALFYDRIGKEIEKKLEGNGYYTLVDWWGKKNSENVQKEVQEKVDEWIGKEFLSHFMTQSQNVVVKTNIFVQAPAPVEIEENSSRRVYNYGSFSFTHTPPVSVDREGYLSFKNISDLKLAYRDKPARVIEGSFNIPNELISGNRDDGLLQNFNKEPVEPPLKNRIDINKDGRFSLSELDRFYEDIMSEVNRHHFFKEYTGPENRIRLDKRTFENYVIARYILDK